MVDDNNGKGYTFQAYYNQKTRKGGVCSISLYKNENRK